MQFVTENDILIQLFDFYGFESIPIMIRMISSQKIHRDSPESNGMSASNFYRCGLLYHLSILTSNRYHSSADIIFEKRQTLIDLLVWDNYVCHFSAVVDYLGVSTLFVLHFLASTVSCSYENNRRKQIEMSKIHFWIGIWYFV